MTDTIHTTNTYEPDHAVLNAAADSTNDADALAKEAIATANTITNLTNRSELVAAYNAAKLAANLSRQAALEYECAAELLQLEASRQNGRLTPPAKLHRQRQDADNPAPIANTFFPWLG